MLIQTDALFEREQADQGEKDTRRCRPRRCRRRWYRQHCRHRHPRPRRFRGKEKYIQLSIFCGYYPAKWNNNHVIRAHLRCHCVWHIQNIYQKTQYLSQFGIPNEKGNTLKRI